MRPLFKTPDARLRFAALTLACSSALIGCGGQDDTPVVTRYSAEIARTSYGVPHIKASNFSGLGYGMAFAYAEDNICMLADHMLSVRGERSRFFGPTALATAPVNGEYGSVNEFITLNNQDSDFFFKGYLDSDQLKAGYASASQEVRDILEGYVAGYNRFIKDNANSLPTACKGAPWVRPITVEDMQLLIAEKAIHASGEAFAAEIVAAARDVTPATSASLAQPMQALAQNTEGTANTTSRTKNSKRSKAAHATLAANDARLIASLDQKFVESKLAHLDGSRLGSNGTAFGKDVTANGKGILLGNPHFPWIGPDRFYQVHLTVPGRYDAMGVTLGGLPLVQIGFNKDLAWTHTVTAARHFTLFRLNLDSSDTNRTTYTYDNAPVKMTSKVATIDILQPNGTLTKKSKTFYFSKQGAVLVKPESGITWTATNAVVLADPNRNNTRMLDQWIGIGQSNNVTALKKALDTTIGLPWVNTVAADRDGNTLYADASVVPHMTSDKFAGPCALAPQQLLFDGSKSACGWGSDANAPSGIFSGASAPSMMRTDYVNNSNLSYWLTNAKALLTGPAPLGFSPLYGSTNVSQSLRTRMAFTHINELLARSQKVEVADAKDLLFGNRIYAAELIVPDLVRACTAANDATLTEACSVLSSWDKRANLDSRGTVLFREFWNIANSIPNKFSVVFDKTDPVNTPRGLAPAAAPQMLQALKAAVDKLRANNVPLNGTLGDYQSSTRNGTRIPIHGGLGSLDGSYNATVMGSDLTAKGYLEMVRGTSYIQAVTFDETGPVVQGLLAYSQSTDPKSPYYFDQTTLYSKKELQPLPFSESKIKADPKYSVITISE